MRLRDHAASFAVGAGLILCKSVIPRDRLLPSFGHPRGENVGNGVGKDANFPAMAGGPQGGCNDGSFPRDFTRRRSAQPRPRHFNLHLGALGVCGWSADWGLFVFVIEARAHWHQRRTAG